MTNTIEPKLHEARLVGSYHARKAMGARYLSDWFISLPYKDMAYVRNYEDCGEWGRLDFSPVDHLKIELNFNPDAFMEALRNIGSAANAVIFGLSAGLASIDSSVIQQEIFRQERDEFEATLRAWHIPYADYLAQRWLRWLLPSSLQAYGENLMYESRMKLADCLQDVGWWLSQLGRKIGGDE